MPDQFKNAKWYIGGEDELNQTIYDASDLEGNGPDGHGMVCEGATLADARLIALAPELLCIVKSLVAAWDSDDDVDDVYENRLDKTLGEARRAIYKVQGFFDCEDGMHNCYNTNQPCGCRCENCVDKTEPRCDTCNSLVREIRCILECENEPTHSINLEGE